MGSIETPHINATTDHLSGNLKTGRYVFLTGSDERARTISQHFLEPRVFTHPRQHNLYTGYILDNQQRPIEVASISSGIGGSSTDIILNELIMLGARRFLRIGTAGSLQPKRIHVGDLVVATAAVRDDKASWDYIHREYPAVASSEYLVALHRAQEALCNKKQKIHFGIVHSKSSLYAREFHYSFMKENDDYMESLQKAGVLASEMECAQIFTLSSLMSARLLHQSNKNIPVFSGCILIIVGDKTSFSAAKDRIQEATDAAIDLGIESVKQLFSFDNEKVHHY